MDDDRTGSSARGAETPSDAESGAGDAQGPSPRQDIGPHLEAWRNFYRLTKWSTIGVAVVLILLALFLL